MKRYIYILECPISSKVVYVGETSNINVRYNSHKWGNTTDSQAKKSWTNGLKEKGLSPIMKIVDEAETKRDALIKESQLIDKYLAEGLKLFNAKKLLAIKQFDKNGNLLATFVDARHAKEVLGYELHIGRGLNNGYLFTKGGFDNSFFIKESNCRKAKMKKVLQQDVAGKPIKTFEGVREAGRITGIDHRSIAAVAGGSQIRKTAGGYKWAYA